MIIDYRDNEQRKICEDSAYALRQFPQRVIENLNMLLYKLSSTSTFALFRRNPANKRYKIHTLKGDKKDLISLRLDIHYRVTVKIIVQNVNGQDEILIWEVSNHYGD